MERSISNKTVLSKSQKNSMNSLYKYKSSNIPFCFHQQRIACFPSPAFEQSSQRWRTQLIWRQNWSLYKILKSVTQNDCLPAYASFVVWKGHRCHLFGFCCFCAKPTLQGFSLGVTIVGPLVEFPHNCHLPLFHLAECEHHFILPTDVKRRVAALYMNSGNLSKRFNK